MVCEINPSDTTRGKAFALWMNAPNPMVTFLKTFNVTNLVRISRRQDLKFNMLLDYCIGKAASTVKEFYLLPVGGKLMQYDALAVNTIVKTARAKSAPVIFCSQTTSAYSMTGIFRIPRRRLPAAKIMIYRTPAW